MQLTLIYCFVPCGTPSRNLVWLIPFLIEYDPVNVHFDPIPALIGERCPQLRDHYVRAWLYGHLKTRNAEYFIVDGYVRVESETHPGIFSVIQDDGFGVIVELQSKGCVVEATPYVFFSELNTCVT